MRLKMYSSHHTKIMEKCPQDQVLFTPRQNESGLRLKSFLQFGLGLKSFCMTLVYSLSIFKTLLYG
jgi:hypothetical protein